LRSGHTDADDRGDRSDRRGHSLDVTLVRVAEDAPAADRDLTDVCLPAGSLVVSDDGERISRSDTALGPQTPPRRRRRTRRGRRTVTVDARGARNWQA
jgi:hypothetical protein